MKQYLILPAIAVILASCQGRKETVATDMPEAVAEAGAKPYPLKVCIVSGEKLGEMGEPVSIVREGQTIKFCCDKCVPKFKENPATYLSQLDATPAE